MTFNICMIGLPIVYMLLIIYLIDFSTSADTSCLYSYLKTHEGLCGPSNVTNDIDKLTDNLYLALNHANEELASPCNYPPNYIPQQDEEFDFIVVGAGAGGSAVANRLSEVAGWKVLLLEVGGDPPRNAEVPALANSVRQTEVDWQYKTEPSEDSCRAFVNGSCLWPRGKALGGTTILNAMVYLRGNHKDYDDWNQRGWRFDQVLPYFKKSEDFRVPSLLADPEERRLHGVGGPVKVEPWLNSGNPVMQTIVNAVQQSGYEYNRDCNGETQLGVCPTFGLLEDHRRCHAAKAYLTPIKSRENLLVARYSLVTKVLIENNNAYGVEFVNNQGSAPYTVQVRARKETIVCGGAVNTPQLLMLSGVGPKAHLSDLGIPVVKDSPVGENLQDHLSLLTWFTFDYNPGNDDPLEATFDFLLKRPSTLSNLVGQEVTAFLDLLGNDSYPDIQFELRPRIPKDKPETVKSVVKYLGFTEEIEAQFIDINKQGYTLLGTITLLKPYSRGKILLKSTDPKEYPRIIAGYLSDKRDVDRLVKLYDFFQRLANTTAFKQMGATLYEIRLSDCEPYEIGTYEYRECYVRHLTTTLYHPSSTCAMGAVLDAQLRVRGVRRLRVADASVFPFVVSGNTAPTYMVGEKAADMIKRTWLPKRNASQAEPLKC